MMLSEKELKTLSQTATTAAKAAGEYIQAQFDQHYDQTNKAAGDSLASQIVTAVDLQAQEIILHHLQPTIQQYDFGLLTEEAADDESRLMKPYFWCIDPLDGTLPFTEGRIGYAVSIALITQSGDPLMGVVYVPDLQACYTSIKGEGVRLNDAPFVRKEESNKLHVYMDRSLQTAPYIDRVNSELSNWAAQQKAAHIQIHVGYGAVRNALGVMASGLSCYFKFPKKRKGGGSIWDYAATRLFFEELGLQVSNAYGKRLHLNNPDSTFMNETGILYSTHSDLAAFIIGLDKSSRSD